MKLKMIYETLVKIIRKRRKYLNLLREKKLKLIIIN